MQKGQILIWVIVGAVIIAIAGGAYYLGKSTSPKPSANSVVTSTATPSSTPLSTETSAKVADETANWKTYTSENFSYSFKYPPNFWISSVTTSKKVTSETSVTTVSDAPPPPTNTVATMSITDLGQKPNESLNILVNRYMADRTEYLIQKSKNFTVNDHSAIYLETVVSNKRSDLIFIETDDSNVVVINIHEVDDSLQPTINTMLSTFKFL